MRMKIDSKNIMSGMNRKKTDGRETNISEAVEGKANANKISGAKTNRIKIKIITVMILTAALFPLHYIEKTEDTNAEKGNERTLKTETAAYQGGEKGLSGVETAYTKIYDKKESVYYEVPFDDSLQEHIRRLCESNNIDMPLVLAVIERESGYDSGIVGDGEQSFGLMQIQPKWHKARMDRLGTSDLLDPYQNVKVGIDILSELHAKGKGTEWTLMAYNGGEAFADANMSSGTVSEYARDVMERREELKNSKK